MKRSSIFIFLIIGSIVNAQNIDKKIFLVDEYNYENLFSATIFKGKRSSTFITSDSTSIDTLLEDIKKGKKINSEYFFVHNFSIYMTNYMFAIMLTNAYGDNYYNNRENVKFTFELKDLQNINSNGKVILENSTVSIKKVRSHTLRMYFVDMSYLKLFSQNKDVEINYQNGKYVKVINVID